MTDRRPSPFAGVAGVVLLCTAVMTLKPGRARADLEERLSALPVIPDLEEVRRIRAALRVLEALELLQEAVQDWLAECPSPE
jgi:hypothetical protein